jgi:hypothetical protein
MEHTKKMILVPESTLLRMKNPVIGNENQISSVDNEMEHVLGRTDLHPGDQLKLYNQLLERYISVRNPKKANTVAHSTPQKNEAVNNRDLVRVDMAEKKPSDISKPTRMDMLESQIIDNAPRNLVKKTAQLLQYVKENPAILKWDERGQLIYRGETVAGSNVVDIFRDMMVSRKSYSPKGWQIFLKGLRDMDTPKSYIQNQVRRKRLEEQEYDNPRFSPMKKSKMSNPQTLSVAKDMFNNWLMY